MRVAVACDWFLKYAVPQAVALRNAGADVALLCRNHAHEFGGSQEERDRLVASAAAAGVKVFALPGRVSSGRDLPWVVQEALAFRRWRPDLVHAQDNHDPRLYALARGYPIALTVHDPTPHLGARAILGARGRIRRAWLRSADRLIVHGEELRRELEQAVGAGRIAVLPHGTTPRRIPDPCPAEPSVLFFGRLERYKGLGVLLEAMDAVWRRRPDVRLLVFGKGPEAELLPEHPRIESVVGYVPEPELDAAFRSATLLVLPYVQASQSGVGLLALARGIPALVTNVGALPELALDSSFVVPPRDAQALAAALLRHLDHDEPVRQAVLERARSEFSWDVVARQSVDLYARILGGRR